MYKIKKMQLCCKELDQTPRFFFLKNLICIHDMHSWYLFMIFMVWNAKIGFYCKVLKKHNPLSSSKFRPKILDNYIQHIITLFHSREIKTFGLVLEFVMSFLWWNSTLQVPIFLNWVHSSNQIGPVKGFLRLLSNFD